MKKLFTLTALILPALAIATPADNANTASLPVCFAQIQGLNTLEDHQLYQKGRRGDSGFRSMDYIPKVYDNEKLENRTYKKNITETFEKPGIVFGRNCFHWKNCLIKSYRSTNGYERAYKKFEPTRVEQVKPATRGNLRGRKNQLNGERSGLYKLERWGR
jgi:hypothetical protein